VPPLLASLCPSQKHQAKGGIPKPALGPHGRRTKSCKPRRIRWKETPTHLNLAYVLLGSWAAMAPSITLFLQFAWSYGSMEPQQPPKLPRGGVVHAWHRRIVGDRPGGEPWQRQRPRRRRHGAERWPRVRVRHRHLGPYDDLPRHRHCRRGAPPVAAARATALARRRRRPPPGGGAQRPRPPSAGEAVVRAEHLRSHGADACVGGGGTLRRGKRGRLPLHPLSRRRSCLLLRARPRAFLRCFKGLSCRGGG